MNINKTLFFIVLIFINLFILKANSLLSIDDFSPTELFAIFIISSVPFNIIMAIIYKIFIK